MYNGRGRLFFDDITNAANISTIVKSRLTNFRHMGFHAHSFIHHDPQIVGICRWCYSSSANLHPGHAGDWLFCLGTGTCQKSSLYIVILAIFTRQYIASQSFQYRPGLPINYRNSYVNNWIIQLSWLDRQM